jgi:transcriptional regulator of arginine metabolism
MPGKTQRQHRISGLLEHHAVSTQEQLVELLSADGVEATQATVSRDLEELGAVKVRVAGGDAVYALPELPSKQVAPGAHLRRVLGDWVVEVASSGNLVVLRTPPGSAHVVGSALDRSGFHGIVGTVAGDDTVLVVASEDVGGIELASRLSEIAGFDQPEDGAGQGDPEIASMPAIASMPEIESMPEIASIEEGR